MDAAHVRPLAVLTAAIATFLVGGLWYSPVLFAKAWADAAGLSAEELRRTPVARTFGISFLLALVSATNLAFFLGPDASVGWGLGAGALASIGWVGTSMGVTYSFERRPLRLFLIDAGYHVVSFLLMGAILAAWK